MRATTNEFLVRGAFATQPARPAPRLGHALPSQLRRAATQSRGGSKAAGANLKPADRAAGSE